MRGAEVRQLAQGLRRVLEQEVGDDRQERRAAEKSRQRGAEFAGALALLESHAALIRVEAMHDVSLARARTDHPESPESLVERDEAELILEEDRRHADGGDRARHDGADRIRRRRRTRVESGSIGNHADSGRARLLELADDERRKVCQRGLRPVDLRRAVARLPVAKAKKVEARSVLAAAVIADRHVTHPLEDDELDFGDLGEIDEAARPLPEPLSWNRHPVDDVLNHGLRRQPVAGRVGTEPQTVAEHVGREVLNVFRVHFRAVPLRAAPTPWRGGPSR